MVFGIACTSDCACPSTCVVLEKLHLYLHIVVSRFSLRHPAREILTTDSFFSTGADIFIFPSGCLSSPVLLKINCNAFFTFGRAEQALHSKDWLESPFFVVPNCGTPPPPGDISIMVASEQALEPGDRCRVVGCGTEHSTAYHASWQCADLSLSLSMQVSKGSVAMVSN